MKNAVKKAVFTCFAAQINDVETRLAFFVEGGEQGRFFGKLEFEECRPVAVCPVEARKNGMISMDGRTQIEEKNVLSEFVRQACDGVVDIRLVVNIVDEHDFPVAETGADFVKNTGQPASKLASFAGRMHHADDRQKAVEHAEEGLFCRKFNQKLMVALKLGRIGNWSTRSYFTRSK